MLKAHDKVVAGISGGADSVCLLFVLLEYRKRMPFSLAVVHVNHGIRREAYEDEQYVEEICRTHEIPFYPFHVDVRQRAKQGKCSEEEAGRIARYEAYAQVAEKTGAEKIAVAHNCNDRSETMLFHLFRGSGIKGLGSIRPVRENIIRPILCLERREVEEYLDAVKIPYCQDATNEKDDYTRNRIRHHILPYAEKEIAPGCVSHMAQTADMLAETEDYLELQTAAAMRECVKQDALPGKIIIDIETFLRNHNVIRCRILYAAIISLAESAKDITQVHVDNLLGLITGEGNRIICLPYGIRARREYDKVLIERGAEAERSAGTSLSGKIPLRIPAEEAEEISLDAETVIRVSSLEKDELFSKIPQSKYTKWFDYDKIKRCPAVRYREPGDYLTIADGRGNRIHKSIKDYMITEKIPRNERNRIPLIADGSHVIWLIGYRISEDYKVGRNTKRVLQVQLIRKGCDSGETEEENG